MPHNMNNSPISLPFPHELREAEFVERPNRFLVRCLLINKNKMIPAGGKEEPPLVEAHLADPGRLKELLIPGRTLWLAPAQKPGRKTGWSVVLCETPDRSGMISLDSTLPNRLVEKALRADILDEFAAWRLLRREHRLGSSRWDFLLEHREDGGKQLLLEVKSVTLVVGGVALFPDAVTERGARHLRELSALALKDGWDAAVLFVVQREDAVAFRPAAELDPAFAAALGRAHQAGVKVYCRSCRVTPREITLAGSIPVHL